MRVSKFLCLYNVCECLHLFPSAVGGSFSDDDKINHWSLSIAEYQQCLFSSYVSGLSSFCFFFIQTVLSMGSISWSGFKSNKTLAHYSHSLVPPMYLVDFAGQTDCRSNDFCLCLFHTSKSFSIRCYKKVNEITGYFSGHLTIIQLIRSPIR